MPRPPIPRTIQEPPRCRRFQPVPSPPGGGVPLALSLEGCEALRLSDLLGLDQETAAREMGVSRPTYGRILTAARGVVAEALVTGRELEISGGNYVVGPRGRRHRGGPGGCGGGGRGRHGSERR
ncbi:MAG: DUF134 domain-containing protein [Deltaproteobacteria bacterium]|nr:DUF134 domain-containing protein [Candidatus Anaeroferrophillacea bacterium]